MFISFEGIDGCGKSTQAQMLEKALRDRGHATTYVREPGNTPLSEQIRAILLDNNNDAMTARTELLLFNAARAQLVETVIRPALANGAIVLCDRFTDSTVAYQAYGRGTPLEEVLACNIVATGGLSPDLTFYFAIALDEADRRSALRDDKKKDRIESLGREYFERVLAGYQHLQETEAGRFLSIDGVGSIDDIHQDVLARVLARL